MSENPRRGRQARNFTTNVPKILDLKSFSEQIFFRKLSLGAPDVILAACCTLRGHGTHLFTVVFVSGRRDLPSDGRSFSLTSFEA